MSNGKTVILSDIHISNDASYSWFNQSNSANLCSFLEHCAQDQEITELVLLGDILDTWLYPVDVQPWTAQQIIQHLDPGILTGLKSCVESIPHVYYLAAIMTWKSLRKILLCSMQRFN